VSDYVAAILEAVGRLSKLIDDVLDLTQGDISDVEIAADRVDLGGLCLTAIETVRSRLHANEQTFDVAIDPSTGTVTGDARRLRESLEQLLRNAVSYTQRGGHIAFQAHGDEREVRITIADNGPGITIEDQARVFSRFHRVGGGTRGEAALGLGLPLTRQFIEAHGGTVELLSAVGEGTAVTLTIPRTPSPATSTPPPALK